MAFFSYLHNRIAVNHGVKSNGGKIEMPVIIIIIALTHKDVHFIISMKAQGFCFANI